MAEARQPGLGLGRGKVGNPGTVRSGEKVGRRRLAGKEQPVRDWRREHGAVPGMAGRRVGIGAARPRLTAPP